MPHSIVLLYACYSQYLDGGVDILSSGRTSGSGTQINWTYTGAIILDYILNYGLPAGSMYERVDDEKEEECLDRPCIIIQRQQLTAGRKGSVILGRTDTAHFLLLGIVSLC